MVSRSYLLVDHSVAFHEVRRRAGSADQGWQGTGGFVGGGERRFDENPYPYRSTECPDGSFAASLQTGAPRQKGSWMKPWMKILRAILFLPVREAELRERRVSEIKTFLEEGHKENEVKRDLLKESTDSLRATYSKLLGEKW